MRISDATSEPAPLLKGAVVTATDRAQAFLEQQMLKNFQPKEIPQASAEVPIEKVSLAPEGQSSIHETAKSVESSEVVEEAAKPSLSKDPTEESISSQYANLARREKAIRAKAQADAASFKAREAELIRREEALKAKDTEYSTNYIQKDRLTSDTINTLLDAGLSYDQITEAMLQQQSTPDFTRSRAYQEMQSELKALKMAQEQTKKSFEEQQTQSYQSAIKQISADAKKLVFTDPNFEMIKETNSVNDVVELIESTFKESGSVLSVEEAAQMVEEELVEEAMRISKIKKLQQKLSLKESALSESQATDAPKQQQLKTLTNSVGSSRKLTATERAMLVFRGELK